MSTQSSTRWQPTLEYPGPDTGVIPGAIYDRPSEIGGYEYSQETHYELVRDLLHKHNIYVAEYIYEEGTGGNVNRKGYRRLIKMVDDGRIKAVGVDTPARLGRDGDERIRVVKHFKRRGVPVWRADKGCVVESDLMGYVEAWYDEEYLHEQARKAIGNLPKAIKRGKHVGRNNIGYKREYRYLNDDHTEVESVMVEDKPYADLARTIYRDYDRGVSVRHITAMLNAQPLPNPYSDTGAWCKQTVYGILRSKVYLGRTLWGWTHSGKYGAYEGIPLDEAGEHPPIIDSALHNRVQARLATNSRTRKMNHQGAATPFLDGILVCSRCGAKTYPHYVYRNGKRYSYYICANRNRGLTDCKEPTVSMALADDAVLREVARLKKQPWNAHSFDDAVRKDPNEALRRRLQSEISELEREMQVNAQMLQASGDIGPEAVAAFREIAKPLGLKIRHKKDQLATLPETHVDPVQAKDTYDLLGKQEVADFIRNAQQDNDQDVLKDILKTLVASARITERDTFTSDRMRSAWVKATVEWTPEVALLLDAGEFVLGEPSEKPAGKTAQELQRERMRRYREKKRQHE